MARVSSVVKELREAKNLVTMAYATLERAAATQEGPRQFERQTAIVALMALADDLGDSIQEVIWNGVVHDNDGDAAGDVG
jgi:hypothetical protein